MCMRGREPLILVEFEFFRSGRVLSVFYFAVQSGEMEMVKFLLSKGADVNDNSFVSSE